MDLYGSWDSVNSNSNSNANSGTSTPVASTSTAAAAAAAPSADDGKKAAAAPTLEQELEQMGSFVSGIMGKSNLGSVWGNFRRQVGSVS